MHLAANIYGTFILRMATARVDNKNPSCGRVSAFSRRGAARARPPFRPAGTRQGRIMSNPHHPSPNDGRETVNLTCRACPSRNCQQQTCFRHFKSQLPILMTEQAQEQLQGWGHCGAHGPCPYPARQATGCCTPSRKYATTFPNTEYTIHRISPNRHACSTPFKHTPEGHSLKYIITITTSCPAEAPATVDNHEANTPHRLRAEDVHRGGFYATGCQDTSSCSSMTFSSSPSSSSSSTMVSIMAPFTRLSRRLSPTSFFDASPAAAARCLFNCSLCACSSMRDT